MNHYLAILLGWNVVVFLVYGLDKLLAKQGGRRASEASLLLCAFLLGGWGAMLGMVLFHHKVSKPKFRFWVPLAFVIGMAIVYGLEQNFS